MKDLDSLNAHLDWAETWRDTDGCSSGPLKYIVTGLKLFKRNYSCSICVQHDFDYRHGWKYGITKKMADKELRDGIKAAGHPFIAWIVWLGLQNWIASKNYKTSEELNLSLRNKI